MYGTYVLVAAASVSEGTTMTILVLNQVQHFNTIMMLNFDFLALHQHDHTRAS